MAYFARRIRYDGSYASFVALIEIVRKKGGKPIRFVLYRYRDKKFEMITHASKEEAQKYFPRGNYWEKTTGWLYRVSIGGSREIYSMGAWVKVGRSGKRNRKFRLRFGELGHILLCCELQLKCLSEKKFKAFHERERKAIAEEIQSLEKIVQGIKNEMKFKKNKNVIEKKSC